MMHRERGPLFAAICLALALSNPAARAQEPNYQLVWVKTILGPCCGDAGVDLSVDAEGAVLVAGHRGGLDLDRDGSVDVGLYGAKDSLIFKSVGYDNEEGMVWGPGSAAEDRASGIASDRQGGAYAVGSFEGTMNIAGGKIHSLGRRDGFLVRYTDDGERQWARAMGAEENDELHRVASDGAGNSYVVGTIRGAIDIDRDGTIDAVAVGGSSILLASFDPNGELRWARASAGSGAEDARAIALGPQDELYIGGFYRDGTLDLDADGKDDGPAVGPAAFNGFYARFDTSGRMRWQTLVSGADRQLVGSLAVAGNGDLLAHGGHDGSSDLDGDGAVDVEFKTLGDQRQKHLEDFNSFLVRVTPEGELIWARRFTMGGHIATDGTRIAMSGMYSGPLDLDDDGKLERRADPDEEFEGFTAILDGQGEIQHVFTVVGGDSDVISAAGFTPDGKQLYVTGYTKLGADFDADGKIESASKCHQLGDVFLALYDVDEGAPEAPR